MQISANISKKNQFVTTSQPILQIAEQNKGYSK